MVARFAGAALPQVHGRPQNGAQATGSWPAALPGPGAQQQGAVSHAAGRVGSRRSGHIFRPRQKNTSILITIIFGMSLSMDTVITILGILSHISPRRKDGERDADGDC